jgi:hypothetical protein
MSDDSRFVIKKTDKETNINFFAHIATLVSHFSSMIINNDDMLESDFFYE